MNRADISAAMWTDCSDSRSQEAIVVVIDFRAWKNWSLIKKKICWNNIVLQNYVKVRMQRDTGDTDSRVLFTSAGVRVIASRIFSSDQDLLLEPWITLVGFFFHTRCHLQYVQWCNLRVNLLEWRYLQLRPTA